MKKGTIVSPNMQVCFVNTTQKPEKVVHHNIFSVSNGYVSELVTHYYKHPDAPDVAFVTLLTWDMVCEIDKNSPLPTLYQTIVGTNEAIRLIVNGQKKIENHD